jgi:hypothetical protein
MLGVLWSDGTGADVMKRIAARMVGGLVTSFVLELFVYPAIFAMWKRRELPPGDGAVAVIKPKKTTDVKHGGVSTYGLVRLAVRDRTRAHGRRLELSQTRGQQRARLLHSRGDHALIDLLACTRRLAHARRLRLFL